MHLRNGQDAERPHEWLWKADQGFFLNMDSGNLGMISTKNIKYERGTRSFFYAILDIQ